MKQTCILILGMHRGGTSALTGMLGDLGVNLGSQLHSVDVNEHSTEIYESNFLRHFDVSCMQVLGSQEYPSLFDESSIQVRQQISDLEQVIRKEFGDSELFAINGPRLAYLYPIYVKALEGLGIEVRVVIPYAYQADWVLLNTGLDKRARSQDIVLWSYHLLLSEQLSRCESRIFVSEEDFLSDPQAVVKAIDEEFDLGLLDRFLQLGDKRYELAGKGFNQHSLYSAPSSVERPTLVNAVVELLSQLNQLESFQALDKLRDQLSAQQSLFYANEVFGWLSSNQNDGRNVNVLSLRSELALKSDTLNERDNLLDGLTSANKQHVEQQKELCDRLDKLTQEQSLASKNYNLELGLLRRQLVQRDKSYQEFQSAIYQSMSWRVTRPLRSISTNVSRFKRLALLLPSIFKQAGGLTPLIRKAIGIYRAEGLRGVKARLAMRSIQYAVLQREPAIVSKSAAPELSAAQQNVIKKSAKQLNLVKRNYDPEVISAPEDFSQEHANLKIAVVIHVFYLDVFESLLARVKNIKADYDLVVTVSLDKRAETERLLADLGLDARIIQVDNEGYDILPFIKTIPYLLEGNYQLVCKLHTKKGLANLEKLFPNVGNIWLDILLSPIMGNEEVVRQVLYAFSSNPKLGMVGAADMYKSSKHLMYGNEVDAAKICQLLNPSLDPATPWGFVAGSIFWAKTEALKPLMLLLPMLESVKDSQSRTGSTSSVWHALERVLGLLPRLNGLQTALAYSHDQKSSAISILNTANSPLESGSGYGVGSVLVWHINYARDLELLRSTSDFSSEFYLEAYPYVKRMGIDPLRHYLRYGVLESCNPNVGFSSEFYLNEHADVRSRWLNPLVHYVKHGRKDGRSIFPAQENLIEIMRLVRSTALFNSEFYLSNNRDVSSVGVDPLQHFCQYGWREHRQPCSGLMFDMLWYADENFNTWLAPINPLLHYACVGKGRGISVRPQANRIKLSVGVTLTRATKPRRICLFAGYDRDGVVEEYVIQFIRELQKYSDVYYLADGNLIQSELDKLKDITKGAWAIRHGEYDFGSYSRLALYLVGWATIRQYDELLLVNDSSYLISSLGPVFSKMDAKPCDWWGLQATKGLSATRHVHSNTFQDKIPADIVFNKNVGEFEKDETYDFHIGSYFLAFRQPALAEGGVLQRLLDSVSKEINKKNIILRYEIGLTRRLLAAGNRPATFIDYLYPFHPIFTKYHFDLVREGFPLFKRFFLTENHYHVPELWRWKDWLAEIIPEVDLSAAEKNLKRICDPSRLYRNLHIPDDMGEHAKKLLTHDQFVEEDNASEKDNYSWAFPVCAYDELLGANERMLFEAVKDNPQIRKIVLCRSKAVDLNGENVHFLPLQSLAGQRALISSRYIFIKHAPTINMLHPVNAKLHRIINLWHGIPLKRIGYASLDQANQLQSLSAEHARCHAVIASSKIDRMAMAAAFYPLSYHDVWATGLPRNDVILRDESDLPVDFQEQLVRLREALAGRRLVLFAPTFRNAQGLAYYSFSDEQRQALFECLNRHGAVLGIREHMADWARSYSERLAGKDAPIISLDRSAFADIELLYREADLLITDYSSCFIDFMLTGKPEICFAYDYESYSKTERGLFYELDDVFPGPVCFDFDQMLKALEDILNGHIEHSSEAYKFKRKLFFDFIDDNNAQRLVSYVENDIRGLSL